MVLIWRRIFPGKRRRRLLAALPWCDDAFSDSPIWPTVRKSVERLIYSSQAAHGDAVTSDLDAANMVLFAAYSVCKVECGSGRNHVYRSTLGIRGISYRALAETILHELEDNRFMTADDVAFEIDELSEAVASAG